MCNFLTVNTNFIKKKNANTSNLTIDCHHILKLES